LRFNANFLKIVRYLDREKILLTLTETFVSRWNTLRPYCTSQENFRESPSLKIRQRENL